MSAESVAAGPPGTPTKAGQARLALEGDRSGRRAVVPRFDLQRIGRWDVGREPRSRAHHGHVRADGGCDGAGPLRQPTRTPWGSTGDSCFIASPRIELGQAANDDRRERCCGTDPRDRGWLPFPSPSSTSSGGVGKTAVVEALGSTLTAVRDDRVLALDIDAATWRSATAAATRTAWPTCCTARPASRYEDIRARRHERLRTEVPGCRDRLAPGAPTRCGPSSMHAKPVFADVGRLRQNAEFRCDGRGLTGSRALVVVTSPPSMRYVKRGRR